jgi:farnesyl-diphosphate farnesyltransferase
MLQKVSRTFALNIQVLPMALKRQVLLAYLFCRMADTIEDEPSFSSKEKKDFLDQFAGIFLNPLTWKSNAELFHQAIPKAWRSSEHSDYYLTAHPQWPLELFFDNSSPAIASISRWVREMCHGMRDFSLQAKDGYLAINTLEELDEYCYYVAGTVGFMLSELFFQYSPLITTKKFEHMNTLANSFGLGLQITNIVKDIVEDYHRKTCFIPQELFEKHGIQLENFLDPNNEEQSLKVVHELAAKALHHLRDAMDFTLLIPRLEPRIRLFCLWPLMMALATLKKIIADNKVLSPNKVKITRKEVKKIISQTTYRCLSNSSLNKLFDQYANPIKEKL